MSLCLCGEAGGGRVVSKRKKTQEFSSLSLILVLAVPRRGQADSYPRLTNFLSTNSRQRDSGSGLVVELPDVMQGEAGGGKGRRRRRRRDVDKDKRHRGNERQEIGWPKRQTRKRRPDTRQGWCK